MPPNIVERKPPDPFPRGHGHDGGGRR
jgi:hypothetical protein